MKRGRILDAFVIETIGLLLVLWLLGATFFFKQIPHPQDAAVAELNSDSQPIESMAGPTNSSGVNQNTFLGNELSEEERRAFTDQQLTLFGNAAKELLTQVGKNAVHHLIQQVTASKSVSPELSQPQPVSSQPVSSQPVSSQPVSSQPVSSQPGQLTPQRIEPVNSQSVNSQPVYQQPVYQQPVYQQPVYQQPVYQQPVVSRSVYQQPIDAQSNYQRPSYQRPNRFGGNPGHREGSRTIQLSPSPQIVRGRFYR